MLPLGASQTSSSPHGRARGVPWADPLTPARASGLDAHKGVQGAYVVLRSDNHPVSGELRGQLSPAVYQLAGSSR